MLIMLYLCFLPYNPKKRSLNTGEIFLLYYKSSVKPIKVLFKAFECPFRAFECPFRAFECPFKAFERRFQCDLMIFVG